MSVISPFFQGWLFSRLSPPSCTLFGLFSRDTLVTPPLCPDPWFVSCGGDIFPPLSWRSFGLSRPDNLDPMCIQSSRSHNVLIFSQTCVDPQACAVGKVSPRGRVCGISLLLLGFMSSNSSVVPSLITVPGFQPGSVILPPPVFFVFSEITIPKGYFLPCTP